MHQEMHQSRLQKLSAPWGESTRERRQEKVQPLTGSSKAPMAASALRLLRKLRRNIRTCRCMQPTRFQKNSCVNFGRSSTCLIGYLWFEWLLLVLHTRDTPLQLFSSGNRQSHYHCSRRSYCEFGILDVVLRLVHWCESTSHSNQNSIAKISEKGLHH